MHILIHLSRRWLFMTFISSTNISVPFTRSLEKTSPSQPFPFNQEVPARKAELGICTRLCGLKISSDLLKLQSRTQARRPAQLVTLSISPFAQARGEPQAHVRMMLLLLPPEFSFLYQSEPRNHDNNCMVAELLLSPMYANPSSRSSPSSTTE